MSRDPKIEVAAINLRIPETNDRDYTALVSLLSSLKRGVRVFGDSYVAIRYFNAEEGIGIFSKYTEIDIDGDWFDLDDFDSASDDKIDGIKIPDNLKPNHHQFYFQMDTKLHVIAFSSYAESKALSARSVEKYFKEALRPVDIRQLGARLGC